MINIAIGAIDQISSLIYLALSYIYTHFRIFEIGDYWHQ
jgi:hypothetical protein